MAHQNLPHDIIVEILSRLPVKSLFRFRCASKPWLSSISRPDFVKKHLNLSVENNILNIILNSSSQLHSINCHSSKFDQAIKMDYPLNSPNGPKMLGSCDGLVCISLSLCSSPVQDVICLWNPSTKEFKKLPSTRTFGPAIRSTLYGFGYDPVIDDYKVVRIVYFYGDRDKDFYSEVKVYTLGTNSWKRVVDIPYYICGIPVEGVFVNGALHWVGTRGSPYEDGDEDEDEELIVAFDLVNGEFREVPRPHYLDGSFQINVLEGCLCALSKLHEVRFEVWVMMGYGVQDSWTKQFIFTQPDLIPSFMRLTPITFCKTGELLLDKDGEDLLLYHPKHVKAMTLKVHGIPDWFEAYIYVESLVSLKSGTYVGQGASGSVT